MLKYNPVTGKPGDCIAVGRGAIAIRLALEKINKKGNLVLVPANICYAAVLPIIYAGYQPYFCDVDSHSGNVTLKTIKESYNSRIVASIIPHMYGNPILELKEIIGFFHSVDVIVIEDCASLMAKQGTNYVPGSLGDFVIYSTGYSKTIDIGFGGMLYSSKFRLTDMEDMEQSFKPWSEDYRIEWNTFSHIYRVLRNEGQTSNISKVLYHNLPNTLKESYTFSISENQKEQIFGCINDLEKIILERCRQYDMYNNLLNEVITAPYIFDRYAVPWRFNLLVNEKDTFIKRCLRRHLPVSDWYPMVTPIFGVNDCFDGAHWHENHIVNFPIMIEDNEVYHICEVIKELQVG